MKIARSFAAVLIGCILAAVVITAVETLTFVRFKPADAPGFDDKAKFMEWMSAFQADTQKMGEWIKSLPLEAMVVGMLGWQVAAFLGGMVSASIAGRARWLHAGIIGGLVLALTIFNMIMMKEKCGYTHPGWLIVASVLLPLPISLLAGSLVSRWFSPTAAGGPRHT